MSPELDCIKKFRPQRTVDHTMRVDVSASCPFTQAWRFISTCVTWNLLSTQLQ